MKKEIIQNDKYFREFQYIVSKKKYAVYYNNRNNNYKSLSFFKNRLEHRLCNIGPQFKDKQFIAYIENDNFHNLYDYAFIDKSNNTKSYYIYNIEYTESQFKQYINILNNLSYKRIY